MIVVMDPVGEVERIGLVALLVVTAMAAVTTVSNETNTVRKRHAGDQAREEGETGD